MHPQSHPKSLTPPMYCSLRRSRSSLVFRVRPTAAPPPEGLRPLRKVTIRHLLRAAGRPCWTSTWEALASASPTGSTRRRATSLTVPVARTP